MNHVFIKAFTEGLFKECTNQKITTVKSVFRYWHPHAVVFHVKHKYIQGQDFYTAVPTILCHT